MRLTAVRRELIRMAAGLEDSILDDDAPLNRTRAEYQALGVKDGNLVRAHRAVSPAGRLPLVKPSAVQAAVRAVMGVELSDDDIRVIVLRLCLGSTGPLNRLGSMKVSAYGLLAAVVCQPHLGAYTDLDRSTGAIHDVLLFGSMKVESARQRLDACMDHLEGRETAADGRYRVADAAPAMAYRAPEHTQQELFV